MENEAILQCPACRMGLSGGDDGFFCSGCKREFKRRAGLLDFLLSGEDQWEQIGRGFMNGQEEMEKRLLETPLVELSTADRLIKAVALWYRGDFEEYRRLIEDALTGIYTDEYNEAMKKSLNCMVNLVKEEQGVILDLASGMGGLLQELLSSTKGGFISVDVSPTSSFGLLQYLRYRNWGDRVQQLIADAACLPLKDNSVDVVTTAAGFQNMQDAEPVFKEIRRVSKKLITLCIFFERDDPNLAYVRDKSLHVASLFREGLEKAGWSVSMEIVLKARAEPTPQSEILGIRPDRLPVSPTIRHFVTVVAV